MSGNIKGNIANDGQYNSTGALRNAGRNRLADM
jgi:hypothetical protein